MKTLKISLLTLALGIIVVSATKVSLAETYNPEINPSEFTTNIDNKYFTLFSGLELEYSGETDEGTETVEISIDGKTRKIMGVTTLVYRDKVWLDGELVEDTEDYLAQDADGNVWYFGEEVDNYENGKLVDHDGSWIAGVDGAKPGIWMKGNPKVADTYKQEFYAGEAEDEATVLSLTETVKVPFGTFTNCLKTLDVNPLEEGTEEHKYYCPEAKAMVLEVGIENGERIELVEKEVEDDGDDEGDDEGDEDEDGDDEEGEGDDEDEEGDSALRAQLDRIMERLLEILAIIKEGVFN